MGAFGIWQWVVILAIVLILFARPGKISGIMGDFGKGLRNFKSGMKDDAVEDDAEEVEVIEAAPAKKPAKKAAKKSAKKAATKKAAKKKTAAKKASRKAKAKS